jgi:hypothetical protein
MSFRSFANEIPSAMVAWQEVISSAGLQLTELGIATAQALAKESFPIGPIGKD